MVRWIETTLGSFGWNLPFNCFLGLPWPKNVRFIAYTADASLLISDNTCREFKEIAVVYGGLVTDCGGLQANPTTDAACFE